MSGGREREMMQGSGQLASSMGMDGRGGAGLILFTPHHHSRERGSEASASVVGGPRSLEPGPITTLPLPEY